jgi:hypothetical protein
MQRRTTLSGSQALCFSDEIRPGKSPKAFLRIPGSLSGVRSFNNPTLYHKRKQDSLRVGIPTL